MRRHAAQALSILGWFDDSEFDGASDSSLQTKVAREGKLTIRLRKHRHREQSLRRAKLRRTLERDGRLLCEVPGCGFDFAARCGSLGEAFAEVHHLVALSTHDDIRETKLEDLAIVCSNCHSMIHRDGGFRTLDEVSGSIKPALYEAADPAIAPESFLEQV
jgi:predicted HNH restriction endonuclease